MSFFINEIQNLRAQVSALKADKERLENKYATTVELGLLTCTVAKLATEQAKEWEFRANAAKEIVEILTIEDWIRIIRMLMEERHKFLLEELRQLARDNA